MNKNITHNQAVTWIDKITTSRRFSITQTTQHAIVTQLLRVTFRTRLSQQQCWRQGWGINTAFPHPKQVRSTYLIPCKYYARSRPKILVVLVTAWLKYTINTTLKPNSIKPHVSYFTVINCDTQYINLGRCDPKPLLSNIAKHIILNHNTIYSTDQPTSRFPVVRGQL